VAILFRVYGAITAALGLVHVVYNALWLGRPDPPFATTPAIIGIELGWALVSFAVMVAARRSRRSPILPATYLLFTAITFVYAIWLGMVHGIPTDAIIPSAWKVFAIATGAYFVAAGGRLALTSSNH